MIASKICLIVVESFNEHLEVIGRSNDSYDFFSRIANKLTWDIYIKLLNIEHGKNENSDQKVTLVELSKIIEELENYYEKIGDDNFNSCFVYENLEDLKKIEEFLKSNINSMKNK